MEAECWRRRPGGDGLIERFETKLIGTMHDGVVFVDSQLAIFEWNTGAERLTGIGVDAAQDAAWTTESARNPRRIGSEPSSVETVRSLAAVQKRRAVDQSAGDLRGGTKRTSRLTCMSSRSAMWTGRCSGPHCCCMTLRPKHRWKNVARRCTRRRRKTRSHKSPTGPSSTGCMQLFIDAHLESRSAVQPDHHRYRPLQIHQRQLRPSGGGRGQS